MVQQLEGIYFSGFELRTVGEVIAREDVDEGEYEKVQRQVGQFRRVHPRLSSVVEVLRAMSVLEEGDEGLEGMQERTVETIDEAVGRWGEWHRVVCEAEEWLLREGLNSSVKERPRSWPEGMRSGGAATTLQ